MVAYSRGLVDEWNADVKTAPLRVRPLFVEGWGFGFDALVVFVILVVLGVWYPDRASLDEEDGVRRVGRGSGRGGMRAWFGKRSGGSAGAGMGAGGGGRRGRGASMRMDGLSRA